ncbi:MAG: DEAD/DEAH box helicase family protein [Phenylobacterium sp.]|nr:DEAD/DEAH box helicase family protein [Phenylobacterium sp.]
MRFQGAWRDYQAQVLGEMEGHLTKGRLHIVAAPGAGKTILGLEIVRRLGRPALVFAPTIAIRDQWADRLAPLFLPHAPIAAELSHQLAEPRELTLATYQALDAFRRSEAIEGLAETLNALGPLTLVLDEAHHLRREWWSSIEALARSLAHVRIIGLTATPPYDASFAEWARYESVCGPIDLEIGIPELVRNGDLCPHQDHVILSEPTDDTLRLLDERRRAISRIQSDLWADQDLLDGLENHPWLRRPQDHVEAILEAPEMLSAVIVLLAAAGRKPPSAPMKLLGVSRRDIPPPSSAWLEVFIEGVLSRHVDVFAVGAPRQKWLRERLHRHGLIEGGRVRLQQTRSTFQLMAANLSKLESVARIARAEDQALGDALRMVILADHIRAGDLPASPEAEFRPSKPGVVPIFEHLRRAGVAVEHLGVLTGTLVLVPRRALPDLGTLVRDLGIDPTWVRTFDVAACPDHVRIELAGPSSARLVTLVTALFARGAVRILVGTQSLLGEGWDAPALNSLVLASNTASFMLSNQMRGRAIRVDPNNPGKVAQIWHLATVEPLPEGLLSHAISLLNWGELMDDGPPGLSDLALLRKRFRAFEGISNGPSLLIESGIGRLGLNLGEDFRLTNERAFAAAADRDDVRRKWSESLGAGGTRARVRETAAPNYAPQRLAWSDTIQALGWAALSGALWAVADSWQDIEWVGSIDEFVKITGISIAVASLPKLAKAGRLIWRNGSVEGSLLQVGQTILETLRHAGVASDKDVESARFEVRTTLGGGKEIALHGVSRSLERQVMQAITEVLGPVQNARFVLVRKSRLGFRTRTDYHAVPAIFAAKTAWAEAFARLWRKRVGSSLLVFTRTPHGRRVLLRARAKSMAAAFQRLVDRRSAWL